MVVAVDNVEAADCWMVNTAYSSKEMVMVVVVVEDVVVENGSDWTVVDSNLCKLVEEHITMRKFMLQASKFTYCCLCCILRRGLQNVDSVISCRSGICC